MTLSPLENKLGNKRVAIWGMGREGKTTLAFLKKHFPNKTFTIINREPLTGPENFILEEDVLDHLDELDVVIKSPGISYYHDIVQKMTEAGIAITSATNLWFDLPKSGKVIAITGSNGKSTTSALTHHMLSMLGLNAELGGNIGTPLLSLPLDADYYIVELSSYQTCDLTGTPDLAVLLNLHPEHIQWHKTHSQYYLDKCNLLKRGAAINIINTNEPKSINIVKDAIQFCHKNALHFDGEMIRDGKTVIGSWAGFPLLGVHNLENLCAALTICKALGLDLGDCLKASFSYLGLPHRLQIIGPFNGLTYVNDSISTVPEATIAALKALKDKEITLIVGGEDREQDYRELCALIDSQMVTVICAYETGGRIFDTVKKAPKYQAETLTEAVKLARELMPDAGYIVLSPAAPSYDAFRDFEQRGDLFMKLAAG